MTISEILRNIEFYVNEDVLIKTPVMNVKNSDLSKEEKKELKSILNKKGVVVKFDKPLLDSYLTVYSNNRNFEFSSNSSGVCEKEIKETLFKILKENNLIKDSSNIFETITEKELRYFNIKWSLKKKK